MVLFQFRAVVLQILYQALSEFMKSAAKGYLCTSLMKEKASDFQGTPLSCPVAGRPCILWRTYHYIIQAQGDIEYTPVEGIPTLVDRSAPGSRLLNETLLNEILVFSHRAAPSFQNKQLLEDAHSCETPSGNHGVLLIHLHRSMH